jgi:hypothetical protein
MASHCPMSATRLVSAAKGLVARTSRAQSLYCANQPRPAPVDLELGASDSAERRNKAIAPYDPRPFAAKLATVERFNDGHGDDEIIRDVRRFVDRPERFARIDPNAAIEAHEARTAAESAAARHHRQRARRATLAPRNLLGCI